MTLATPRLLLVAAVALFGCASSVAPAADGAPQRVPAKADGGPSAPASTSSPPVAAPSGAPVQPTRPVRVLAADNRGCALFDDGSLQCWGSNGYGELGAGHTRRDPTPQRVLGLQGVTRVAFGPWRTCAVTSSGALHCWGRALPGAASSDAQPRPAAVAGVGSARDVALGDDHACAVSAAGAVKCWGSNRYGQLGLGAAAAAASADAASVVGLPAMAGVVAAGDLTAAWSRDGELFIWGGGVDRRAAWSFDAPHRVAAIGAVERVTATSNQVCALLRDAQVRCFAPETLRSFEQGREHDFGPEFRARFGDVRTARTRAA